jgi:hypothetical protein
MEKEYIEITLDNYADYLDDTVDNWGEGLEYYRDFCSYWIKAEAENLPHLVDNIALRKKKYRLDKTIADKRKYPYPDLTNAKTVRIRTLDDMAKDPNVRVFYHSYYGTSIVPPGGWWFWSNKDEARLRKKGNTERILTMDERGFTVNCLSGKIEPWMVEEVLETYPEEIKVEHKITVNGIEIDPADLSDESLAKILEAAKK